MKYLNFNYLVCIGGCLSQLAYTVLTDCDNPNLSICGEVYRHRNKNKRCFALYRIINTLFFWQKDHCRWAYMNDLHYSYWYVRQHSTVLAQEDNY